MKYYGNGYLVHYGVGADNNPPGRGSGRYPKGSGERPFQHVSGRGLSKKSRSYNTKTTGVVFNDDAHFTNASDYRVAPVLAKVSSDGTAIVRCNGVARMVKDDVDRWGELSVFSTNPGFHNVYTRVNPNYGERGTTNNCPFVGAAMEVASRGYKVIARRAMSGASAGKFTEWFDGAKNEMCQDWDEMKNDILADGNGASGVLQGYYGGGLGSGMGGHTLHWRNEYGRIIVADGQSHKEMEFDDVVSHYGFNRGKCIRTRLDNCEPNWDNLSNDGVLDVDLWYPNSINLNGSRYIKVFRDRYDGHFNANY